MNFMMVEHTISWRNAGELQDFSLRNYAAFDRQNMKSVF